MSNGAYRISEYADKNGSKIYIIEKRCKVIPFVWCRLKQQGYGEIDEAKLYLKDIISANHPNAIRNATKKTLVKIRGKFSRCDSCTNGKWKNGCSVIGAKQKNDFNCGFYNEKQIN